MDVAALVVSVIAICTAGGSFVLAVRADRRADRAERRQRQGRPILVPSGGSGGATANPVQHSYGARNAGQASITELWIWIVDADGNTVSNRAGGPMALPPGDPPVFFGVEVRQPLPETEQTLMVEWRDADGTHTESTDIHPPQHH